MSLTEQQRSKLYQDLEGVIGSESAGNLMSHLPPVGWEDLATKRDVDMLRIELRGEIAELRGEFGGLRGEFGNLRSSFGELRGDFGELKGEMHSAMNAQTKGLFFGIAGLNLTTAGLVAAVLHFV